MSCPTSSRPPRPTGPPLSGRQGRPRRSRSRSRWPGWSSEGTIMRTAAAALSLLILPLAVPAADPLPVGHRGLPRHAPENTLAAFAACLELRLGFELDVRRSKDGARVGLPDDTVHRTTDGTA